MSVMDCELSKIILKKFGYLEKRVTYLEDKSRDQQNTIQRLQTRLSKLESTPTNKGQSQSIQEGFEELVDVKPDLDELLELTQNAQLNISKNDQKLSQKLVVQMGLRCTEKVPRLVNSSFENHHVVEKVAKSKMSQSKTKKRVHPEVKTREEILLKPKRKVKKYHICAFCSKSFPSFANLSTHMRVHTGERPFKCNICSKAFTNSANLKRHSRVHTGEKPYSCSVCSIAFARQHHLNGHMLIHTGERPYSCLCCPRTFVYSSGLNQHLKLKHKGETPCLW